MSALADFTLVFISGLITALATGLGALPYFFKDEVSDRWTVGLWGLASGIMLSASVFGLVLEGLAEGTALQVFIGGFLGGILVFVADKVIHRFDYEPKELPKADFTKLVLILGILTVHSFPEGVAIGVSFADLNLAAGIDFLGFTVPVLAVFMTIAISIHNIPEGLAISIPIKRLGLSKYSMVWWAIFSSLPQPIGAVIAYYFVTLARAFLPYGFGFAAGAMSVLVVHHLIPEGLEEGEELEGGGKREMATGLVVGFLSMLPLVLF